jgi:hypothetical protein
MLLKKWGNGPEKPVNYWGNAPEKSHFHRRLGSYATRRLMETFPRLPIGKYVYSASLLLIGVAFFAIGLLSIFGIIPLR